MSNLTTQALNTQLKSKASPSKPVYFGELRAVQSQVFKPLQLVMIQAFRKNHRHLSATVSLLTQGALYPSNIGQIRNPNG